MTEEIKISDNGIKRLKEIDKKYELDKIDKSINDDNILERIKYPEEKDLYKIDKEKIKKQILYSDNWEDILEIYDFCYQLLSDNNMINKEKKFTLNEIVKKLKYN